MASVGAPDAKGLEGRQEGEPTAPRSREFFWDSLVLFVVAAIVALTAIDAVAEFIRGSDIQCFLPNSSSSLGDVKDYVIKICAGSLPRTEYLPAYITIHAILILAPHYLWLNTFGAKLDFFFQHVSQLVRTRDEKTGEYAKKNYVISQQLENAFNRSNWMYYLYLIKLAFQFAVSVVGFVLVLRYLNNYREVFPCPANDDELESEYWPLQNQTVRCVFTSLRLLGQINVAYLILLAATFICLLVSMIWLVTAHPSELGIKNVANFSFQSGLSPKYHSPEPPTPLPSSGLGAIAHTLLSSLQWFSFRTLYNIQSDYDFLVIKLFRTEGGLAYVLREVHTLRLLKEENDLEYARVNIYKKQLNFEGKRDIAKASFLQADLGLVLPETDEPHKPVDRDTPLSLPHSVRGVVLGFAARVLGSVERREQDRVVRSLAGALCVGFDSESLGFAGALARVFTRVGVINFSPYFMDYINTIVDPVDPIAWPHIVTVTCPEDILASGKIARGQKEGKDGDSSDKQTPMKIWDPVHKFYRDIDEIWKPGIISARVKDAIEKQKWNAMGKDPARFEYSATKIKIVETDYIVVGPLTSDLQVATVNLLLQAKEGSISNNAILLTVRPLRIAGRTVESEFKDYKPPSYFPKRIRQKACQQASLEEKSTWPTSPVSTSLEPKKFFEWEMKAEATDCKFRFTLYERGNKEQVSDDEAPSASHWCPSCWRREEETSFLLQTS